MKFGKAKVSKKKQQNKQTKKKELYDVMKSTKIWDVDADNIVISKLIKTENNSKDLNAYLNEIISLLILISLKMNRYVTMFKFKNKKLMSLSIDDDKPFEKY